MVGDDKIARERSNRDADGRCVHQCMKVVMQERINKGMPTTTEEVAVFSDACETLCSAWMDAARPQGGALTRFGQNQAAAGKKIGQLLIDSTSV